MEETENKIKYRTEEHHRRPTSLDGNNSPSNISYVIPRLHRHWHTLVGNMNAYQTANKINKMPFKPENVYLICDFINGNEVKKTGNGDSLNFRKLKNAWDSLFINCNNFEEIIYYINNVWLDPAYRLRIINNSEP